MYGVSFLKLKIIIKIQGKVIYFEKFMIFWGWRVSKTLQSPVHLTWHILVCNENLVECWDSVFLGKKTPRVS